MEEFEERFYQKPYETEYTGQVMACEKRKEGYGIVLDDTVFYPEGGGQLGDTGTIDGVRVLDTVKENGVIVHVCEKPLAVGSTVKAAIDWDRRLRHMQEHSGEHIVSGLVHQLYGYDNVGFHMGETVQIDFDGVIREEEMCEIEKKANALIYRNVPVRTWIPDADVLASLSYRSKKELKGKVRIVTIPGADQCACCGTHVSHTGEIGMIRILSLVKHKNGMRVNMLAGEDCYDFTSEVLRENSQISHLLSAPVTKTYEAVERCEKEKAEALVKSNCWMEKYVSALCEQGEGLFVLKEEGMDRLAMRKAAGIALEQGRHTAVILNQEKDNKVSYLVMSDENKLGSMVKGWNEALQGRGGGKDDMVQGSFQAEMDEVEKVLREALQ